ncbi:MAG: DMT family transporter [Lachnospiraceae bacterium]|nr:DMT family transporter [Lachnospiraceae bacterium]
MMDKEGGGKFGHKGGISGIFFILIAGACWGSIGIFVRKFNSLGLVSMDIVAVRSVFTAVFMAAFLAVYDRSLLKIRLRDIWCFAGTGIVSMVFFNYCYFGLIRISSLSVAAVMLYTAPAFVMLLSAVIFHERITAVKVAALVLTFVGCCFVTGVVGSRVHLTGRAILLGLGAGLGYALYSIFGRFALMRGYHSFTINLYTFLFASLACIPLVDAGKIFTVCTSNLSMAVFSVLCGLVTTMVPYIAYNFGLAGVETGKAAIIASIEPVVATLIGAALFGERPGVGNIIGIILVLAAIVLCNLKIDIFTGEL